MVTMVGTESDIKGLIENLLYLEHDAIAAYDQTIEKLENAQWKHQVSEFKSDHLRHVQDLMGLAGEVGANAPKEGDSKQMLTTGKIKLASMMGDKSILLAMRTNEEDTVTAYERASQHGGAAPQVRQVFERAHRDELRHRDWMSGIVNS